MRGIDRVLHVPVAAVRPYLALKVTLLLLPFDIWLTRMSHGGRYGVGGFNVAHFGWLDAVQPEVSPELFGAVSALTAFLCLMIALTSRAPRWLIGLALLLHTWSWAMSMLDSYQHHYLLSLVLLALMFFPRLSAEDALIVPTRKKKGAAEAKGARKKKRKVEVDEPPATTFERLRAPGPWTSAWGYVLLGASTAIVYAYTAYAKTEPEWLSGAALRSVLHLPADGTVALGARDPIGPFRDVMGWLGIDGEPMWSLMGHSVVLVQIICAAGYLVAPFADAAKSRALRAYCFVALFTALSFHLGAEYMGLEIGWFSWYMVAYALIFFLPASWLVVPARVVIPLPGVDLGKEITALRIGVIFAIAMVGLSAGAWTALSIFGVSLAGIFGDGWNLPIVAIAVGLAVLGAFRFAMWAARRGDGSRPATRGESPLLGLPRGFGPGEPARKAGLAMVGLAAASLVGVGVAIDLPGAQAAGILTAVFLGALLIVTFFEGTDPRALLGLATGAVLAAICMVGAIAPSEVRWEYYKRIGGVYRRHGEYRQSLEAYLKANEYAPEGENRDARIEELRERIAQEGE